MGPPELQKAPPPGPLSHILDVHPLAAPSLSPLPLSRCSSEMLNYDEAAAANGWGRRHLRKSEAWALYRAGYPCPPDMRVPSVAVVRLRWELSVGAIPVPPVPYGEAEFRQAID